jgi:hypothetical protein
VTAVVTPNAITFPALIDLAYPTSANALPPTVCMITWFPVSALTVALSANRDIIDPLHKTARANSRLAGDILHRATRSPGRQWHLYSRLRGAAAQVDSEPAAVAIRSRAEVECRVDCRFPRNLSAPAAAVGQEAMVECRIDWKWPRCLSALMCNTKQTPPAMAITIIMASTSTSLGRLFARRTDNRWLSVAVASISGAGTVARAGWVGRGTVGVPDWND